MNNKNEKTIYLGSGRKRSDSWMTISICLSDAEQYAREYKGKKYLNLNVNVKSAPDQYGKDVSISLDQYKKDENAGSFNQQQKIVIPKTDFKIDDADGELPF